MKPILKRSSLLLVCAALLAGCSTSTTTTSSSKSSEESSVSSKASSKTSSSKTSEASSKASSQESSDSQSTTEEATAQANQPTGNSLLNALLNNADDDEKAEEAWMNLFKNTVEAYDNALESAGDGEIYEYQTASESSFVTAHLLYQTARLDGMSQTDNEVLIADFSDLANSDDAFISGTGVLISMGEENKGLVVKTTDTLEEFKGSVTQVFTPTYNQENLLANNLRDSVINCGIARTVDPVHNSSLYTYSVKKKRQGYRLILEVKDLDTYKAAAAGLVPVVDNLDGKVVLGLDDIDGEAFYFDFDQNGVLTEVSNNIFHAVYTAQQKVYVNVRNKTEVLALKESQVDDFNTSIGELLKEDLAEGDDFSIKSWQ